MRNVFKMIETAEKSIPKRDDITVGEFQELYWEYQSRGADAGALFYLISNSFLFGYAVGVKAGKREGGVYNG